MPLMCVVQPDIMSHCHLFAHQVQTHSASVLTDNGDCGNHYIQTPLHRVNILLISNYMMTTGPSLHSGQIM